MSVIHKLLPNRAQAKDVKIIADFDDLISQPIGFKVLGKVFEIKPVDTETFMKVADCLGNIHSLLNERSQGKRISDEDVYESYYNFVHPLCPALTLSELKKLAIPQLNGLINLIIKHVTGATAKDSMKATDAESEDQKKN